MKIRRLCDIASVFLSMGLLAKVDERAMPMEARRPRFMWSYIPTECQGNTANLSTHARANEERTESL
jgi:hypothetical protein